MGTDTTKLLVRAGLIREFGSGLWGFTPVGQRIRRKLIQRIRAGMDAIGGQSVRLPGLQYRKLWDESGRWKSFENEMFTLHNRDGQDMCLAPSHEEGAVHLLDNVIQSYEELPLLLYQIESKFRDDHARNGLLRCKEFTMKDAYSVHADEASLDATYHDVWEAYERILTGVGLEFAVVEADNSVMGGSVSEEFVATVENGSDRLIHCTAVGADCRFGSTNIDRHSTGDTCPDCGGRLTESGGIEVGHVFKLGTRYSAAMNLTVDDCDGRKQNVMMGSYGLGIDRLLQTLAQQHASAAGCRWPVTDWGSVAPYRAAVLPIGDENEIRETADHLHEECGSDDVLLFDEPSQSVGECFAECELLGIPATIIVGNHYRETGLVDIETPGKTRQLAPDDVAESVARFAAGSECPTEHRNYRDPTAP